MNLCTRASFYDFSVGLCNSSDSLVIIFHFISTLNIILRRPFMQYIFFFFSDECRITPVVKVETDIITSIAASAICMSNLQIGHYCFYWQYHTVIQRRYQSSAHDALCDCNMLLGGHILMFHETLCYSFGGNMFLIS
jgi:hypothetical protein